jgi:hypothetical protein
MAKDNDDKDVTAIRETRPCGPRQDAAQNECLLRMICRSKTSLPKALDSRNSA